MQSSGVVRRDSGKRGRDGDGQRRGAGGRGVVDGAQIDDGVTAADGRGSAVDDGRGGSGVVVVVAAAERRLTPASPVDDNVTLRGGGGETQLGRRRGFFPGADGRSDDGTKGDVDAGLRFGRDDGAATDALERRLGTAGSDGRRRRNGRRRRLSRLFLVFRENVGVERGIAIRFQIVAKLRYDDRHLTRLSAKRNEEKFSTKRETL